MRDLIGVEALCVSLIEWDFETGVLVGLQLVPPTVRNMWLDRISSQRLSFRQLPIDQLYSGVVSDYRPRPSCTDKWLTITVLMLDGGA